MADEQLKLLLSINDRMSKGLEPGIRQLRRMAKDAGTVLAVLRALEKQTSRPPKSAGYKGSIKDLRDYRRELDLTDEALSRMRRSMARPQRGGRRAPGGAGAGDMSGGAIGDIAETMIAAGTTYKIARFYQSGIKAAGDYEAAILKLRFAFAEFDKTTGKVNEGPLSGELERAGKLAVELGNQLQGSTLDYANLIVALRQGGLDTKDIFGGAAQAAANLANTSGAVVEGRADTQARSLAQFQNQFGMKGSELGQIVDVFSALQDRFGIDSDALIESSKMYSSTAGTLGQSGLAGAKESAKLFAFLKQYAGMEGTIAGTTAQAMFTRFATRGEKGVKELKQETGIDLQLFDQKGKFLGYDQVFKELEKLRKLSSEERLQALSHIFGEEGARAAGAMVERGVAAWRNIGEVTDKAVPAQVKLNEQMKTYLAKVEAVQGSWENLKATMFTGTMDWLKPDLDHANQLASALQDFSKAHPTLTKTALLIVGIGTAVLGVATAIKSLKVADAIVHGLTSTAVDSTAKMGKLGTTIRSIPPTIPLSVGLVGAAVVFEQLASMQMEIAQRRSEVEKLKQDSLDLFLSERNAQRDPSLFAGGQQSQRMHDLQVSREIGDRFGQNRDLSRLFDPFTQNFYENLLDAAPLAIDGMYPTVSKNRQREAVSDFDTRLTAPGVMKEFIAGLRGGSILSQLTPEGRQSFESTIAADPQLAESYKRAIAAISAESLQLTTSLMSAKTGFDLLNIGVGTTPLLFERMNQTTQTTTTGLNQTNFSLQQFPFSLNNASSAANDFATRMRNASVPQTVAPGSPVLAAPPKSAIGSVVNRDGLVHAHRGNVITPASLSRRSPGDWIEDLGRSRRDQRPINLTISPIINLPAGSTQADATQISRMVVQEIDRLMDPDRIARMVAAAAQRDDELT